MSWLSLRLNEHIVLSHEIFQGAHRTISMFRFREHGPRTCFLKQLVPVHLSLSLCSAESHWSTVSFLTEKLPNTSFFPFFCNRHWNKTDCHLLPAALGGTTLCSSAPPRHNGWEGSTNSPPMPPRSFLPPALSLSFASQALRWDEEAFEQLCASRSSVLALQRPPAAKMAWLYVIPDGPACATSD